VVYVSGVLHPASSAPLAGESRPPEELAKAWLLRVIDRTPLTEVADVGLDLLTTEATPLIAEILEEATSPGPAPELPPEWRDRARDLGRLRRGPRAPSEVPRDLATLQSILIEALRRAIPERENGDFARSVARLAEIFGQVQASVTESLVRERAGDPRRDELTGLPGSTELHEWLQILLAEYRRYGHPFAVALIDIEGLGRINDAYGREAGDRMLAAVAGVISNQVRMVDRPFRLTDDEFCVLAPHERAERAQAMAQRLVGVIQGSQEDDGPRIAISVGVSACPEHGDDPQRLVEIAEEATYAAKAAGEPVAVAAQSRDSASVQDR
jgi:diguanylate cyclase (GGDEF)-like protein